MPLSDGIDKLLALVKPQTEVETVPLSDAAGRVLAENVVAKSPVPGFDNSAMDGYAIRLADINLDVEVPIQGKSFAGQPFHDELEVGKAIRIMTGAAVPKGADTIIMQENTTASETGVTFHQLANVGNNIRGLGEDIAPGAAVLELGVHLNAAHIALLASVGCATVDVYRRTRIGLLSTGDELKTPGETLGYGDIYNSNGPAVFKMLSNLNAEIVNYGILEDDPDVFRKAFLKADSECDFVITSGGVSVGEADYTKDILDELGEIDFWKLAIKPGKPFAFGKLPNSYFIGLPGNPVSAMVTFHILASQAIRQHQNIGYKPMKKLTAVTKMAIRKSPGRMDFQRGVWQTNSSGVEVHLTRASQGSHILTSLAAANCYIALEKDRTDVEAGETVELWLFDEVMNP
jgi:molybdopterin molybdotransferase